MVKGTIISSQWYIQLRSIGFVEEFGPLKIELTSGAGDKGYDHIRVGGHTLMMIGSSSARTEEASRAEPVTIEARLLKPFILKMETIRDENGKGDFQARNGPQPEVSVTTKGVLPLSKRG
jgi:hypothetical protein